jgi:pimeloyl-ACP methyl ester carboxylesterase
MLHELFVRLPVQYILPAWFLRRTVVNYIMASRLPDTNPLLRLPRHLIDEQFRKIQRWPFVYKFSVLPVIHYFDMRQRLAALTMPVLLINRIDDALSPEVKTHWLSKQLPHCAGYHIIPGGERFFMYSQAEKVNQLMAQFLLSESEAGKTQ